MGRPTKHQARYKNVGRPTVMTPEVLKKLEEAFEWGCPDGEACLHAGITRKTLYNYQDKYPDFLLRKEQLKKSPNLKARKTVVNSLDITDNAWRWLEKKDKNFIPATKTILSGSVAVESTEQVEISEAEKKALIVLREARRKRIESNSDKLE